MTDLRGAVRRHPWRATTAVVLVAVAALGIANRDLITLALRPAEPIDTRLPVARPLQARDGEVVYRIDAGRSEVTLAVDEVLAGAERRVELRTRGIAGDVAVGRDGTEGGSTSVRLGDVVVDVAQLRSDNSLRDKALQHEALETHDHPQVRLSGATVELPEGAGTSVRGAVVAGELDVKGEPHPVEFLVDAALDGDELTVRGRTTVRMSEMGVGPISKAGLVRTSDEVEVVVDLVARDAEGFTPPVGLAAAEVDAVADERPSPSFDQQVRPILEDNCASCHAPGEIGASMWTLADAGDAAEVADGLAVVTRAGYMPPWPASELGVELRHPARLSQDDIDTIAAWADAGAPLDVDSDAPVRPPATPALAQPRPDRVVRMAEPYRVTPLEEDDYRCFVLDPEVTEPSFLTGYTFDPDQLEVVHHAIVTRVRAAQVPDIVARDAADDGPGWSCLAGMNVSAGERIAGWVPGQRPVVYAPGDGFDLQPGDVLVAQIHYHYAPDVPADRSGMTLQIDPAAPGMVALESRTLIGPVELPCAEGTTGPLCDRDAAVADVAERFGPGAPVIANGLHLGCRSTPESIAATFDGQVGSTTCDFVMRGSGEIIGMLGHLHEIGSAYRMTLHPDSDREQVLLDIPVWNFAWQLAYAPVQELRVERGDVIRVSCTWDRGQRVESVPRWIVFAEGTEDEMCYTSLTVRPDR
jgi:polyisoprenoid-binding protein YceI/mono/diheme cytochrome c family protein